MPRETKAMRQERVRRILELLDQEYGTEYRCFLNYETPWQLLIAVMHTKAKNIISCTRDLLEKYGGKVPETMEELTGLAGVGRKTANVIRGNIYGEASIVVDTHVKRISGKLGLTKEEDPEKIEYELMKVLPKDHWILWNIHIITLGRTICTARNPACEACFLREECPSAGKKKNIRRKREE